MKLGFKASDNCYLPKKDVLARPSPGCRGAWSWVGVPVSASPTPPRPQGPWSHSHLLCITSPRLWSRR